MTEADDRRNERTTGSTAALRTMLGATDRDDPGRIPLLLRLAERVMPDDPDEGIALLREAIDNATGHRTYSDLPLLYGRLAGALEATGDPEGAIAAAKKGLAATPNEETAARADLHLELTRLCRLVGDYPRALGHARDAIDLFGEEGANDPGGSALALKGMADLYAGVGDTTSALALCFDALRKAEEADSDEITGVCLCDIALLQSEQGEHDRAIDHLLRARDTFAEAGLRVLEVRTLANLASVSAAAGRHREGLEYGLRAMAIYTTLDDRLGLATTLANLSRLYRALDDPASALECSRKAYDLFDLLGDDLGRGTVLLGSGMVYYAIEEYQNAVYIIEQALEVAIATDMPGLALECHEILSRSFEGLGNAARSLEHLRSAVAIRDRLEQEERRRGLADLQAQYDLERTEQEREIYRLKSERLETDNRSKTEELTSMSIRLVEKNRLLNGIRRDLEKLGENAPPEVGEKIEEIRKKIREQSRRDDDWNAFEEQFRKVHHDFIERLARIAPDLTPTELKVSALVRTGLSSAEIAALFHVTRRNIDTHRYRLRKKLGLPSSTSLSSWFAQL